MKNTTIQVKIDNFEGPLDLLIHLIEKNQMNIAEINISKIIDEYLEYLHEQENENLKIKVEFLVMATELLEIKTYSILNKEKKLEKIESLERRIKEYKIFKEISELFSKYEKEYNISYSRTGSQSVTEAVIEYDISSLTMENLFKSFKQLLKNNEKKEEKLSLNLEEEFSINDAYNEIKLILENKNLQENGINFNELLKNNFTKSRIVTMFLCVLDMFKNGNIDIIPQGYSFSIKKVSIL
ncbi:ScpA family protein [Leptotrichia sp. oral taxon 221]|mgnify:FL=1|jgi:scpA/B protein|uniref:segregation and condensation protein A n=1 Tax=Leptotrichia sp. oral taxon 221 TaxID=712362 RepID=UPI001B8C5EF3|nr:ScpA family protein [Leptotrichia sp. oral taxon 221]QUB96405.1 segregation/condensation protein A [Leptotrichia sp. oral taxon 221]